MIMIIINRLIVISIMPILKLIITGIDLINDENNSNKINK